MPQMKTIPEVVNGKSFEFRPSDHCRNLRIISKRRPGVLDIERADVLETIADLEEMANGLRTAYGIKEGSDNVGNSGA